MKAAKGTFEITMKREPPYDDSDGVPLGRTSFDKIFRGDIEAKSTGQMIAAGTPVKGSAGYVAIERVVGTLAGKRGTFVLQHHGLLNRGASTLVVVVVPDSATGELAGLSGSMKIDIVEGKHLYMFDYALGG